VIEVEQANCYVVDLRGIRKDIVRKMLAKGVVVHSAGLGLVVLAGAHYAASTGIDIGAEKVYKKLVNIGKWVIIIKGGIDTIKSVADGDMHGVKKNVLGYGVTYAVLWGLPWMMHEIEKLFEGLES
jgi:hypothetical protein